VKQKSLLVAVTVAVTALVSVASPAQPAAPVLPGPTFTVEGALRGFAAAGSFVAVAVDCDIFVTTLARGTKPNAKRARVRGLPCDDPESEGYAVYDLWLGRRSLATELVQAEGPHGAEHSVWKGRLPSGPLRLLGEEWGWRDDNPDEPSYGCARVVVAGGGVVATTEVPNLLGDTTEPTCPSHGTTAIALDGAVRARTTVQGSWTLLATDGKRLVLSRLDNQGRPAGQLSIHTLDGKPTTTPRVSPGTVKGARIGWLAPEGLVLATRTGLVGPGWTIRGVSEATVAYGRVLYLRGSALRVRRIRDGVDRQVLTLPRAGESLVAAGSFGVAVAAQTETQQEEYRTSVYRVAWRTVDAVLPLR